jgi:hypothetical protein
MNIRELVFAYGAPAAHLFRVRRGEDSSQLSFGQVGVVYPGLSKTCLIDFEPGYHWLVYFCPTSLACVSAAHAKGVNNGVLAFTLGTLMPH